MLERRISATGLPILVSPLLEHSAVPHGFSTRAGGVSPEPFSSLNLGISVEGSLRDSTDHVRENYRRLLVAIGCGNRERCWVTQVHGNKALQVRPGIPFESGPPADALVCDDAGRIVSVKYADCVPILLASEDGRAVAAVHAGWRGVIGGVLTEAIGQLREMRPDQSIVAAIGPCISEPWFEVGAEVLEQFERVFGTAAPIRHTVGGKGHVDLQGSIRLQLLSVGISADHIDTTDRCTFRDRSEFFSHRRDKGITGRMAAVIGPRLWAAGVA